MSLKWSKERRRKKYVNNMEEGENGKQEERKRGF